MFILLTNTEEYIEEYLFGVLLKTKSLERAMVFEKRQLALDFKDLLFLELKLIVSVNTYIK